MCYKRYWVNNIAEEKLWNCYQWKSNVTDFIILAWASLQDSHLHFVSCGPPKGRELEQGCAADSLRSHPAKPKALLLSPLWAGRCTQRFLSSTSVFSTNRLKHAALGLEL